MESSIKKLILFLCPQVEGVVVINNEGIPIKSTLDSTSTVQVRRIYKLLFTKDKFVDKIACRTGVQISHTALSNQKQGTRDVHF
jgi:hypothetical protein